MCASQTVLSIYAYKFVNSADPDFQEFRLN